MDFTTDKTGFSWAEEIRTVPSPAFLLLQKKIKMKIEKENFNVNGQKTTL